MLSKKEKGNAAEELACDYLKSLGYEIIARNWRFSNRGEIDIIAIDPDRYEERYLLFIEVKNRSESMEASLSALQHEQKQRQIRLLAPAFIREHKIDPSYLNISFDLIAVHNGEIEHLKDI